MATTAESALTLKISPETSAQLRAFAAESGDSSYEAITRFVEDTLARRLFQIKSQPIRDRFAHMTPEEIDALVEEALAWARSPEGRECE